MKLAPRSSSGRQLVLPRQVGSGAGLDGVARAVDEAQRGVVHGMMGGGVVDDEAAVVDDGGLGATVVLELSIAQKAVAVAFAIAEVGAKRRQTCTHRKRRRRHREEDCGLHRLGMPPPARLV